MKTIFKQLATAIMLGFLMISPVLAQNIAPLEAGTNNAANSEASPKTGLDKDLEKTRMENEQANSRYDNHRSVLHYLCRCGTWICCACSFPPGKLAGFRRARGSM